MLSAAGRAVRELSRIDQAVYAAVVSTPTPSLDGPLARLSNAANRSVLWMAIAGGLAATGGRRGRRAALSGMASVAVTSAVVNLGMKPIHARTRPDGLPHGGVREAAVRMPASSSFPSGHSASAFAFATAAGRDLPLLSLPLRTLAAAVAYSRVHTGVHYPVDAVAGSLVGGAAGLIVGGALDRRRPSQP